MIVKPPKLLGSILGVLVLLFFSIPALVSLYMLMNSTLSVWMVLWVLLPMICIPLAVLAAYRLYGLMTAAYRLDRNGLYIRWGFSEERLPIQSIDSVTPLEREMIVSGYPRTFRWPGLIVGVGELEGGTPLEFFASTGMDKMILVRSEYGALAISPARADEFLEHFRIALRSGPLEQWRHYSRRPNFVLARLWSDPWARALILIGALLPLSLLAFLALKAPSLPEQVPFGFDTRGAPQTLAPPGRLLLLPLSAGLCWLADLVLGWWSYRRDDLKVLAYLMWSFSLLVGALFWGATLHLIAAA